MNEVAVNEVKNKKKQRSTQHANKGKSNVIFASIFRMNDIYLLNGV